MADASDPPRRKLSVRPSTASATPGPAAALPRPSRGSALARVMRKARADAAAAAPAVAPPDPATPPTRSRAAADAPRAARARGDDAASRAATPRSRRDPVSDTAPARRAGPRAPTAADARGARARRDVDPAATGTRAPRPSKNAAWDVAPPRPATRREVPAPAVALRVADDALVRVSKLMSERGLCSRREADVYIERGWVFVDGQRVTELGTRALPSQTITLDRLAQARQQSQVTVLLNKPIGVVSAQAEGGYRPAVTLVLPTTQWRIDEADPKFHPAHLKGLAPAGRLDIDSTGLLVLTQDGRIARQLIGADSEIEKEYLVRVEGTLDAAGLELLQHGLELDGVQLRRAQVTWINDDQLRFVLREGRKRQIRRMCEAVGLTVTGLKRIRIGRVKLGSLPLGQWRYLRDEESF